MKVTRAWLQDYFEKPLPDAAAIADALTFHAFELEEVSGDLLDVKVLPNRGADCFSVRGIAKEVSAIFDIPLKEDILRKKPPVFSGTDALIVSGDPRYLVRHTGALIRGITVGPSPAWLKERLESVGQRSINNVVDAMNFVMLSIGQPAGGFDLAKLTPENGVVKIDIREAAAGEKIQILTGETITLVPNTFVFTDAVGGMLLDIAGIKGGLDSGITENTKDMFLSVGNYDGTLLRKAAQKYKILTDASQRFQNRPSPELTAYGMDLLISLIKKVAGGECVGVHDIYLKKPVSKEVSTTKEKVSAHLGAPYSDEDLSDVFRRLDLTVRTDGDAYVITPPFERSDLVIPEDLAEEVGRIIGYDRVPATEFVKTDTAPEQSRFRGIERMKDQLVEKGFIEVSTQSFVKKGDIELAYPLDTTRPMLRTSLEETLNDSLVRAKRNAPLVLPPKMTPKLFEVGTVFPNAGEYVELRMTEKVPEWGDAAGTVDNLSIAKLEEYGKDYVPARYALSAYKPFSIYPFVLRDIAVWLREETVYDGPDERPSRIEQIIRKHGGVYLVRIDLFDTFSKGEKTSFAFRLVFEADDKTLTDAEINTVMADITTALNGIPDWEVR
jgi:phenylalanyl-tRNA synthetase beta subunit